MLVLLRVKVLSEEGELMLVRVDVQFDSWSGDNRYALSFPLSIHVLIPM